MISNQLSHSGWLRGRRKRDGEKGGYWVSERWMMPGSVEKRLHILKREVRRGKGRKIVDVDRV